MRSQDHLRPDRQGLHQAIYEVRTATGLGLKEAKDLVEDAPKTIKEALSKEDAEKLKKTPEDQGATVELK